MGEFIAALGGWGAALALLIKAIPAIWSALQTMLKSVDNLKNKAAANTDNSEIKDEMDRVAEPGGRPDAP